MQSEQVRDAPAGGTEWQAKPCFKWPAKEAFLDLARAQVHSNGHARITALALCDVAGNPCRLFEQGQAAHVFYEFEILKPISGAVFGGIELHGSSGTVAHGKSSFQVDPPAVARVEVGQRLRFHHAMDLVLGPGEYTLGVGLASAVSGALDEYLNRRLPWMSFAPRVDEHVRAMGVASFNVGFGRDGTLSHHGIADLRSRTYVSTVGSAHGARTAPEAAAAPAGPTILHVTHWKAGSQWINKILHECVPEHIVEPVVGEVQFLHRPIVAGGVYPTVYVTKQQFDSAVAKPDWRYFVVIRDLRDTLVSGYFSVKVSHPLIEATHPAIRQRLESLSIEDGMLYMMDEWLLPCARIQTSWLEAGENLIKYEDLLADDIGILEPLLIDHCGLPVSRERLRDAVINSRFEQVTGRRRGEEDVRVHERKGIAGDWRNHFTPRLKGAFKARYGGLLAATGYERGLDW